MPFCLARYAILLAAISLAPAAAHAIMISEVMYHPTDALGGITNEWIELYNDENAVNLTGWKIAEPSDRTITGADLFLEKGKYLIIARNDTKFLEYYNVTCFVAKASIALNDAGEWILLKNSSSDIVLNTSYTDELADGNGNSLQKTDSGSWCESSPTPGQESSCEPPVTNETNTTTNADGCDLSLEVISDKAVYDEGETIDYDMIVNDISCGNSKHGYSITYRIEDLSGDFLRAPYTSEYEIVCRHTSSHTKQISGICGTKTYAIKAEITDAGCSDKNPENNQDEFQITINGKSASLCKNASSQPIKTTSKNTSLASAANTLNLPAEAAAAINSFYTLAKNLYANRTINLYADIENLEGSAQTFQLQLNKVKKEISLNPKSSEKFEFSVTLPDSDVNYTLKLLQNGQVVGEKTLPIKLTGLKENLENLAMPTGAVVWTSEKMQNNTEAMLLFIFVLMVLVIALLVSRRQQPPNDLKY